MSARILSLNDLPAAVYAVGDVHGCLDLYKDLERRIVEDGTAFAGRKLIVLLGDVIDRGPNSAGLLDHILSQSPEGFQRLILRGNHEEMFLSFLKDPARHRSWLDFGGRETLASYGLDCGTNLHSTAFADLRHKLSSYIPDGHIEFLNGLPYGLLAGEYFFCHAGADPSRPINQQRPEDLLWGVEDPLLMSKFSQTIVHGHIPQDQPLVLENRINVDTGAYATGRLTAVRLVKGRAAKFL